MNNIEKYFSSPEKTGNKIANTPNASSSLECKKVKDPKGTNKLIVSNMEEVISSVKKKDKQKHQHRRKKDKSRKSESEVADISTKLTNSLSIISPNVNVDEVAGSKSPLKESKKKGKITKRKSSDIKLDKKQKTIPEQNVTKVDLKSPQKNSSIRDHFSSKSKNNSKDLGSVDSKEINGGSAPKLNAFQLLMSGRNKVIGSNTSGKDNLEKDEEGDKSDTGGKKLTAKRKLLLEEWAEKKGAIKRKAEDDARGDYIEEQMTKRAKRLKTMLTTKKDIVKNDEIEVKPKRGRPRKKDKEQPIMPKEDEVIIVSSQTTTKSSERKTKEKKPPKTNKTRTKRLSSYDSNSSIETASQNGEFLANLSSPIKKRDSLLGYFPKIPSPTENLNKGEDCQSSEKCKSKSKISRKKSQNFDSASLEIYSTPPSAKQDDNISSRRPRRSCAGKARYDYDLEKSPKLERTKTTKKSTSIEDPRDGLNIKEDSIINLDDSTEYSLRGDLTPRKLAPVFIKALPKPTLDPAIVKARHEFLMSGVPEKMRLDMEKQKQYEQAFEAAVEIFPKISHVLQPENCNIDSVMVDWQECGITWKQVNDSPRRTSKKQKRKLHSLVSRTPRKKCIPLQDLPELQNKREFVKHLKGLYEKFPTFRCYNQLRQKYRHFCAKDTEMDTQQITESFVVTKTRRVRQRAASVDSDQDLKPPPSAPNGELLFTEKYKPQSFEEILVNLNPARFVKEFLATFQNTRMADNNSSDFELTNDSSAGNNQAAFNFVVLLGPNSSGKTNAVFALANDMNFNVLEINAGIKRTGKKIIQELHEATQSHQISKDKNKLRNSLNGFKKKYQDQAESSSSSDLSGSAKLSLILVEDADVVFEQDAGFVEAIYQLAASSKRPVIITASNSNCQHLYKLINQNSIQFSRPNALNISKFLSILSLIENCPINIDDIVSLYLYNQCNLRKTLLEMQFFIQSGGDRIRHKTKNSQYFALSPRKQSLEEVDNSDVDIENDDPKSKESWNKTYVHKSLFQFYTICQNIDRRIPFPVDFDILRVNMPDILSVSKCGRSVCSVKKLRRKSKSPIKIVRKEVDESLRNISDFYENISTAANIGTAESYDRLAPNLSEDISHFLTEGAIKIDLQAGNIAYNLFDDPKERISLTSYMPQSILKTNRSLSLEYEPCLRSICRSEKIRSGEERRGSRFYHYLRNTCSNINSFSTEVFDSACIILNDDINPNITIPSEEGGPG